MTIITEAMIELSARGMCALDERDPDEVLAFGQKRWVLNVPHARACLESSGLAAEVERLMAALRRYGMHTESCNGCTCGLDDIIGEGS